MSKINKIGYWVSANIWLMCWFFCDSNSTVDIDIVWYDAIFMLVVVFLPYVYLLEKGIEEYQ